MGGWTRIGLEKDLAEVGGKSSPGVAGSLHQPRMLIPALTAELFPPRKLGTCLPGSHQPSDNSRLVLAQNRGDIKAGKGDLVLNQAVPTPPEVPGRSSDCSEALSSVLWFALHATIPFDTQIL